VIADDGIGIAPEFLPHVFERFRQADGGKTRAYSGLGIGLAIVHHVAAAHGGTVTAASEGLDRGSRFTRRLPVAQPADGETPRTTSRNAVISTGESPFSGLRVLLVEDDADLRELLSLVLSDEGSKVTAVGSAREGLEAFGSSKFDLLISDIGLPGEDGLSFMRRVRTFSVVPAVALTGFAGKDEEAEAIAAGFNGYLAKPLHIDQLRSILVELKTRASA
jgi:CheY-like chemotaxis protein